MAAVDYTNVLTQLESILKADSRTNIARVFVEEEPQFGISDTQYAIAVFLDGRSAPDSEQTLSKGRRTEYQLRIPIWVFAFSIESYRKASELRNTLLDNLELTLSENRTLNAAVTTLWLEGGDMVSARDANSNVFVAAAETVVVAVVSVIGS